MAGCLHPIHIPIDDEGHSRVVPCGKCEACLIRSRMEWAVRLEEERRQAASSYFITLTYDNDHLPIKESVEQDTGAVFYDAVVDKRDVQLWLKRFRKELPQLRYYLISEYGPQTYRPHYHGIFFFCEHVSQDSVLAAARSTWHLCASERITVGEVTESRILYVTEYCLTRNRIPDSVDPNFRLISRRPGIGATYIKRMHKWHNATDEGRFFVPGLKPGTFANMPRYWRDKLFDQETRENHTAAVELDALRRRGELPSQPDYDPIKAQLDEMARVADYKRKTSFLLDKKAKKL